MFNRQLEDSLQLREKVRAGDGELVTGHCTSTLQSSHWILKLTLLGRNYHPHFTDGESKALMAK